MIEYLFDFITPNYGARVIDMPEGIADAELLIQQGSGRLGRDVTAFGSGSKSLKIYEGLNQCFDEMVYSNMEHGFNADVNFILKIDGDEKFRGQVDFDSLKTDGVTYCEFAVIELNSKLILKRSIEIDTNLFSNKGLDENDISPCVPPNVLMLAKPEVQISKWSRGAAVNDIGASAIKFPGFDDPFISISNTGTNPSNVQTSVQGIQDTLYFMSPQTALTGGIPNVESFSYVRASENFSRAEIELTNIDLIVQAVKSDSLPTASIISANGYSRLVVRVGFTLEDSQLFTLHTKTFNNSTSAAYTFPTSLQLTIPEVKRNQVIWIYLENYVNVTFTETNVLSTYSILNNFQDMNVQISGILRGYSTVVPMVRIVDAMKYNVLSSARLPVSAPRWEYGGEFYDQFITTQPLMRGLRDKPFNWNFKGIVDGYLPEVFGDYQIQKDGTVYIGIYEDFYRNYGIGSYKDNNFGACIEQIEGFEISQNPSYSAKTFTYKYSTYQSQKENEVDNTYDVVHGETKWYNKNQAVEGSKDIDIDVVRDHFSIDQARRKAYTISNDSATQDDDKIYIVDVVPLQDSNRYFIETTLLQHRADGQTLVLTNKSNFSWILLGISFGTPFTIQSGNNQGTYTVVNVTENAITLLKSLPGSPVDIDEENTTYKYFVSPSVATLVNRTDEGFSIIENLADGRNYANLRFTVKRNILRYYSSYLATCALWPGREVSDRYKYLNSLYKNNPKAITQIEGANPITEGETFYADNPILTTFEYKVTVILPLSEFLDLMDRQRLHNGYITLLNSNGLPLKGYIKSATWKFGNYAANSTEEFLGEALFTIEEKFQPFYLYIVDLGNGSVLMNNEITSSTFDFEVDGFQRLIIYSETGKQLLPPVPYNRIKINNGGPFTSVSELAQTLNVIRNG